MVLPEEFGWPQDIGALGILDGAGLPEPGPFPDRDRPRADRPQALPAAPVPPAPVHSAAGLGWPLWVDATTFNIADHVGLFPQATPADEAQLLAAGEELRQRRLDRSRPQWQMWFLPGLAEARVGSMW